MWPKMCTYVCTYCTTSVCVCVCVCVCVFSDKKYRRAAGVRFQQLSRCLHYLTRSTIHGGGPTLNKHFHQAKGPSSGIVSLHGDNVCPR